jgi:hypothetical protein
MNPLTKLFFKKKLKRLAEIKVTREAIQIMDERLFYSSKQSQITTKEDQYFGWWQFECMKCNALINEMKASIGI